MRRLIVALLGATVLSITSAQAADMPAKAPIVRAPAVYNWTGFYIGINGGGGWGNSEWSGSTGTSSFNVSGGLVGGTVGYNWQTTPWVFGLEADLDWTNIRGSTNTAPCTTSCETKNSWLGTVRGRIGYAFDRVLPYITGGLAVGDVKAGPTGFAGERETKVGWALGGGLEAAIAGPWTAKIEYLYVDLGSTSCAAGSCAVSTDVDFHAHVVRAGVNYRF